MHKKRKYILLVGDGMADYPIPELGGKTPLEVADTPHMDRIAACRVGLVKTIPEGMEPGSDVANLSLLGYDPAIYHTGRAPLEAASMGVKLNPDQVAFRLNLVTLDWKSDQEIVMVSHSAGDISTPEAREVVETLTKEMKLPAAAEIYPGVAYRHLLVWANGPEGVKTIPPHDVLGGNMAPYLGEATENPVTSLIRRSWGLLKGHSVNLARKRRGVSEANSIWLWGQGKAPNLPRFSDKFGLHGGVISAVDLLKGIGIYAGFESVHVEGATGYLDTNYFGKADEALRSLQRLDLMFVHVEAPDEASHNANLEEKIEAIEVFDKKIVGRILAGLERYDDYRIMVVSDHLTPIIRRTHTGEPTPFAWADKNELQTGAGGPGFSETSAKASGFFLEKGHELMSFFLFGG